MSVQVRARGREFLASGDVVDPNDSSLYYNGLSIGRLNPGQTVVCSFTVSHIRTVQNLFGAIPGSDTFTGVVSDANGLVVGLMSQQKATLQYGDYVQVRLYSLQPIPDSYAGQQITVTVGPTNLLANALVGQPLGLSGGTLSASATVPAQVTGPNTVPTPPLSSWQEAAVIAGGVVVLGGVAALAIRHHHQRGMYE
jgi:hypothetical protein